MEIKTEEYNGWTNRETWAVNLHLTNDEGLYNEVNELLKQKYEYNHQRDDALREFVENIFHDLQEGAYDHNKKLKEMTFSMLMDVGSLWRVNWCEIVDSFLEE